MNKKQIAIIGTVGLPPNYGGFETLADNIVKQLGDKFTFTVYCSSRNYTQKKTKYLNANLVYLPIKANGIQSILYDIISIFHSIKRNNILLILGVSGCIIIPFVKLFSKSKIIVNIDGMEWRREKWNKIARWFLRISEKLAVKSANIIISDNKAILDYVKKEYHKESILIEYGGDHAEEVDKLRDISKEFPSLKERYAFSACRIEPENNIHIILEAFSHINNLSLVIAGNWNNSAYGKSLKNKFKHFKNIFLLDFISDKQKLNLLRTNCTIYLHGHSAGGTNPSLVEAMNVGLPVLAYDVIFNRETTENQAIYFQDSKNLVKKITDLSDNQLKSVSHNMRSIAKKRYTWEIIAGKYAELF